MIYLTDFDNPLEALPPSKKIKVRITKLLNRPPVYLTAEEKWILIGTLLNLFGANFDWEKLDLFLIWGQKDLDHLKLIQKLVNAISGAQSRAYYDDSECVWRLEYS
ncbi:MAG: hypothetical protein HeimC3_34400 [Candidatus Heimdallarchaeota archaeon LC_3]|nr:MAG: hypothetical protein HeimC3_34400 [Candidatus Heimdallarchaeota archaeon LC_3]